VKATEMTAGPAESNGSLLLWRDSLHVTCGLTACTPGSAPGPTLGNEYGKTLPLFLLSLVHRPAGQEGVTVIHSRVNDGIDERGQESPATAGYAGVDEVASR